MPATSFDKESIKKNIVGNLQRYHGRTIGEATPQQIYKALASTVRDQIMQKWMIAREERKQSKAKRLYYLSVEFLMGRTLYSNMLNLLSVGAYKEALSELGVDLAKILPEEPEPGLGNGGLGRLAACFLDSLASLDLPAMGCTIRYEYGLFRQKMVDGQQVELPDDWLVNGNVWEMAVPEDACEVRYGGYLEETMENGRRKFYQKDCFTVEAVPYDMPAVGYDTATVNTLRMWRARSAKGIDLSSFSQGNYIRASQEVELAEVISKVLYPEDNNYEGKLLRLKQQYFFTSATLQYALKDFKRAYGRNFAVLPEKAVFHVNDTHPGLVIPEMMRLLMDEEGLGWDEAADITQRSVAYTNHTVMAEALEKWPEEMVKSQLPRIYMILQELNRRLCEKLWEKFPGQWERIGGMAILAYGHVHMANLCVAMSFSVNGVSQLHGEILKADTFRDYYAIIPEKFIAITNGITHRRWLMACNPELTRLITDTIGGGFIKEPERLRELLPFREDAAFREEFARIKAQNKQRLAQMVLSRQNIQVDPTFLFDVQAKRLHEYKRQLLNALHILVLYNRIADDPSYQMAPRAFFFGAKASPGYRRAKLIIRFINSLSQLIARHPRASKMLQVIFLENYDVSTAEILIPAAEISEQISTAGKEASGTGNMKFMMNGALTLGTMDGANVEIAQAAGMENIYIFGMSADRVQSLNQERTYNPMQIIENNQEIRKAMNQMIDGTLFPGNLATLQDLYHSLLQGEYGYIADPYLVLEDFGSYAMAQLRIDEDYRDIEKWQRMAIANTATSGIFSSDRTIAEYNQRIWHLDPLKGPALENPSQEPRPWTLARGESLRQALHATSL